MAITIAIVTGAIAIITVIVRELPAIIHARTIAKTAKKASLTRRPSARSESSSPPNTWTKTQPTGVLGRMIREPPAASSRPETSARTAANPAEQNKAPGNGVVVPFTSASGRPPEAPASGPSTLAG